MANVRKKISELTPLTSASLDTTIVGVDNGTTYKIELDTLADAVTSRVNILDRDRLNSLESVTSSFETKGRSLISSSAQISALGFVSQSVDITSLNSFTQSQLVLNTAFTNGISARLQTSSFNDFSTSVDSRIIAATNEQSFNGLVSGSSQFTSSYDARYVLSGSITQTTWNNIENKPAGLVSQSTDLSSLNQFTASISTASLVTSINNLNTFTASQSTSSLVDRLNIIESVSGSWITESETGSFLTSLNGAISSSSQLTSSYDLRYTLSGSVQPLPSNLVSSSAQITAFGFISSSQTIDTSSFATTGSNTFIGTETISGSLLLSGSFNYNGTPLQNGFAFAQPVLTRILDNVSYTGSSAWVTSYNGNGGAIIVTANVSGYRTTGGLGTVQLLRDGVAVASQTFYFNIANYHTPLPPIVYVRNSETGSHTYSIYFSNILADTNDYATINVLEYGNSAMFPTTIISGSSQLTSSFDTRYAPSASYLTSLNGAYSSSIQTLGGSGVYSSSAQLPSGLISGSSQLTASYDTRYTLSGSVVSGTTPAGTISGSSQLTSSFDGRYVQTGSFNSLTASFNSFTASAQSVTTGSNSFNGTQTITGSLIITTGSFVGSQILANTSSLYLTSGSNMYVQNNGVVEITGSLKVNGITRFETVGGDEGGEIEFGVPQTNTTLSTRVVQDIWQNRLRIFDGNTKGVFIDLSKAPTGVNGEITWKASGYVDAGTFVQLDNIKATVTTSSNRGLSIGAVSTNFSANIGGTFSNSAGAGGNSTQNVAYTTTASTSIFGWNFIAEGDTSTYIINDKTNSRMYRITMMIGPAYLGNFISIERLH